MRDDMPRPNITSTEDDEYMNFEDDDRDYDTWPDAVREFFHDGKLETLYFVRGVACTTLGGCIAIELMHLLGLF